jgi:ubiquinone/menaquinone biosynthesis C-methylase UbiE
MRTTRSAESSISHFSKRARGYNASAHWVQDGVLISKIRKAAGPLRGKALLDLAIGTGAIAGAFKGRAGLVVGVDSCSAMSAKAAGRADLLVYARGEEMPFPDGSFDICTCRQGLQFMDLAATLAEVRRVLRPGGRAVFCHLTSYGGADDGPSFLIQKLRNPARKNFFSPGDLAGAARKLFSKDTVREHITRESVDNWISNGAISAAAQKRIVGVYQGAAAAFGRTHRVEFKGGDVFDSMRMEILTAVK